VLKEGNVASEQQCDVIFNLEHLRFQVLLIILNDKTLLCQICENLKKDLVTISIQGQLRNHHQVQKNSTEHAKFEFQNGLLYFDGLLYVPNGPTRLQVFQAMHNVLVLDHFGFNKTMELAYQNYWWP
jgi:hypothetical protein